MTADLMQRLTATDPAGQGSELVDRLWTPEQTRSVVDDLRLGRVPARRIGGRGRPNVNPVLAGALTFAAVLVMFTLPWVAGWFNEEGSPATIPGDGLIVTSIGDFSWWREVGDRPSEDGGLSPIEPPEGFDNGLLVQVGDQSFWAAQDWLWRVADTELIRLTLDLSGVTPPEGSWPEYETTLGHPVSSGAVILVPWAARIEGVSPDPAGSYGWISGVGILGPDDQVSAYVPPWLTGEITNEPYDELVGGRDEFMAFTGATYFDESGFHRRTTGIWISEDGTDWVKSEEPGPLGSREGWVSAISQDWPDRHRDFIVAYAYLSSGIVETWISEDGVSWLDTGVREPEATSWEMPINRIRAGWLLFPGEDRLVTSPDLKVWTPVDTSPMGIRSVGPSASYTRTVYGFIDTVYWELVDSVDGREAWIMKKVE